MSNHETFGCSCCSGVTGAMFQANRVVRRLRQEAGFESLTIPRRSFVSGLALAAGSALMLPRLALAQDEVATVFRNGVILPVDDAFSQVAAMAIRGERIIAVGAEDEVLAAAGAGARIVDLGGKVVLPGFIDPHTHVIAGAVVDQIMDFVGMSRFATTQEVLAFLKDRASGLAEGEWIVARNFDPSIQAGPSALTFVELDDVSVMNPIFVLNASGHLAYANRKAFEVAGIAADVADPPGGEFVRDEAGRLTGVMKNNTAFLQVVNAYPGMAAADPVEALIGLLDKWTALGMTTVSELSLGALTQSPADMAILDAAGASGRLKARIRAYPFYTIGAEAWDAAGVVPGSDPMVRVAGYKLVADGSNQGFTGLQREPYLGTDNFGLAYMSAEELTAAALDRAAKGWQLAIHGNGDAAIDNILDACDALRTSGVDMKGLRVRIEHCSILHDEQITRMADLSVSASFLIGHVHFWGVAFRDRVFGPEKANLLGRCASVRKAGVGFTLHSDFMVTDPDPLAMIQMAVTRRTWAEPDFVLNPDERISVEDAIRAMTAEAAWQLHSEHEVGSLEPGKFADFVILDADPRLVEPEAIREIAVLETWMNGAQVFAG